MRQFNLFNGIALDIRQFYKKTWIHSTKRTILDGIQSIIKVSVLNFTVFISSQIDVWHQSCTLIRTNGMYCTWVFLKKTTENTANKSFRDRVSNCFMETLLNNKSFTIKHCWFRWCQTLKIMHWTPKWHRLIKLFIDPKHWSKYYISNQIDTLDHYNFKT